MGASSTWYVRYAAPSSIRRQTRSKTEIRIECLANDVEMAEWHSMKFVYFASQSVSHVLCCVLCCAFVYVFISRSVYSVRILRISLLTVFFSVQFVNQQNDEEKNAKQTAEDLL